MTETVLQPSGDADATRLAIAYDIAWGCHKVKGKPEDVAAMIGELVKIMRRYERGA